MISIARRNLCCLFRNPNSFLCYSNVHFLLPIHFFSTRRVKNLIPCPEVYDTLVNKHHFSPKLASLASLRLPKFRDPQRADSVLSYLKENRFSTTQLQKIVMYGPQILGFTIEDLKFKFKVWQDLGLSSEEIAKIISSSPVILHSSMANKIIPSLSMLKGLLRSNDDVARLLKRCSWFVIADLEKTLMPNVEILKSCSIPVDRILHFLYSYPRAFLVKSDVMAKAVDRAVEIGVPQTSVAFIQAVSIFNYTSKGMWEVKLQTLRNLGFADDDIFRIFRRQPLAVFASGNKMKNVIELLLATRKYNISSIITFPAALANSIDKRLEPRMQILRLLESRNLIKKWPCLNIFAGFTDDKFIDRFIRPYYDVIGEEHITKVFLEVGRDEAYEGMLGELVVMQRS